MPKGFYRRLSSAERLERDDSANSERDPSEKKRKLAELEKAAIRASHKVAKAAKKLARQEEGARKLQQLQQAKAAKKLAKQEESARELQQCQLARAATDRRKKEQEAAAAAKKQHKLQQQQASAAREASGVAKNARGAWLTREEHQQLKAEKAAAAAAKRNVSQCTIKSRRPTIDALGAATNHANTFNPKRPALFVSRDLNEGDKCRCSTREPPSVMQDFIGKHFGGIRDLFGFADIVRRGTFTHHVQLPCCINFPVGGVACFAAVLLYEMCVLQATTTEASNYAHVTVICACTALKFGLTCLPCMVDCCCWARELPTSMSFVHVDHANVNRWAFFH